MMILTSLSRIETLYWASSSVLTVSLHSHPRFATPTDRLAQSSDPPSVTRRQGTEGQRDKDWFTVHSGEIHIT